MNGPAWSIIRKVTPHLAYILHVIQQPPGVHLGHFVSQLQMFLRSNLGSENGKRKALIVWHLLVVYAMLSGFWVGSTEAIGSSHGFLGCDGIVSDLPLSVKLLKIRGIHMKKEMS